MTSKSALVTAQGVFPSIKSHQRWLPPVTKWRELTKHVLCWPKAIYKVWLWRKLQIGFACRTSCRRHTWTLVTWRSSSKQATYRQFKTR